MGNLAGIKAKKWIFKISVFSKIRFSFILRPTPANLINNIYNDTLWKVSGSEVSFF